MSKELKPFARTVLPGERIAVVTVGGEIAWYFSNGTSMPITLRLRLDEERTVEAVSVTDDDGSLR